MKVVFSLFFITVILIAGWFGYHYFINSRAADATGRDAFRSAAVMDSTSSGTVGDEGSFIPLDGYILAGEISSIPEHVDLEGDPETDDPEENSFVETEVEVQPEEVNTITQGEVDLLGPEDITALIDWNETPDMMNTTGTKIPVAGVIDFENDVIIGGDIGESEIEWQVGSGIQIGNQELSKLELKELQQSLRRAKLEVMAESENVGLLTTPE